MGTLGKVGFTIDGQLFGYAYLLLGQAAVWLQLAKIVRHPKHDTRALSLPALILWTGVGIAAVGHAVSIGDWFFSVNNGLTAAINAAILGLKARNAVKYRHRPIDGDERAC